MKKISIIVPVYNSEKYLRKCLDSILIQDYKNMEIIIINDGSKDNSQAIIDEYCLKYKKIFKCVNQANHGQAYCRNLGLDMATGELISFIDSDDYIEPRMYTSMIEKMEKENTSIVICNISNVINGTKIFNDSVNFDKLYSGPVSLCNKIFKKSLIGDLKLIENIWYEDYNFFIKLCLKNPTYSICEEAFYNYVIHDNSTMRNNDSLKNLDIITATEDIIANTNDKNLIENIIINHILLEAINRVECHKNKEKRNVIKKLRLYVKKYIKNLVKTEVYKKCNIKKKVILLCNYYNLGWLSNILLKLKGILK